MKWSKDGEWMRQGDRVQVLDDAVSSISELKISQARVEDGGVYSAEASNVHGTVQTTAVVTVTKSAQETSDQQRETSRVKSVTREIVEEKRRQDTAKISVTEHKVVVVRDEKENLETEETVESHTTVCEVATEKVEILTNRRPSHQQTTLVEVNKLGEAQEVDLHSVATTTQASVIDSSEMVSEATAAQQEDGSEEGANDIPATEEKVQSPVTDVIPQSLEIIIQEKAADVSDEQLLEVIETSSVTETRTFSRDISERKGDDEIESDDEVREPVVLEFSVAQDVNQEKSALDQPGHLPERSRTVEKVPDGEADVKLFAVCEEIVVTKQEEVKETCETVELAAESTTGTEIASSAEAAAKTLKAAGVKTVISKETVTKKKKKSKDKDEKTSSETVDVTQSVEEVEEKQSEEMTTGDVSEMKEEIVVKESRIEEDKTVTESITVVEDAVMKNVAEVVAEAAVEMIDVEYSEEEFEGPLPVITVKPLPTTIEEGEVLRLVCEVAEEPEVEITWSKDGKKLENADADARIRTIKDKVGGTYILAVVETTPEDVGEYTLCAESEGGIVSCTISVNVIARVRSDVQSSTVSEETNLSTVVSEGIETSADTEESLVLKQTEPAVSTYDIEETEQQKENIVVTVKPTVAAEPENVEVISADREISIAGEESVDSIETKKSAVVRTTETEITSFAEPKAVSATFKTADVKTVVSKETVIRRKRSQKTNMRRLVQRRWM